MYGIATKKAKSKVEDMNKEKIRELIYKALTNEASVDDVIDPADYGLIGAGYLAGFGRKHSLNLDQLETLGRKIVKQLYKGDFKAAKAKFVKEDNDPSGEYLEGDPGEHVEEGTCGYDRDVKGNKLKGPGGLGEAEDKMDDNRVPGAALILPRGKEVILQAEETDYKRGLLVELTNKGGYKIKYWYGDDVKVYPAEVVVDGESIKKDAKVVDILFHPELKEAFDELDDGFDKELEFVIKGGIKLHPSRLKDVVYYIHNNWMAGNYGDDYAIRRISKFLNALEENIDPKSQKKHKGKAAPYGSAYQKS